MPNIDRFLTASTILKTLEELPLISRDFLFVCFLFGLSKKIHFFNLHYT